jgi:hypothetical protein
LLTPHAFSGLAHLSFTESGIYSGVPLTYYLSGPTGNVFFYSGDHSGQDLIDSGLLESGNYHIYALADAGMVLYKGESFRGDARLDLSLTLTPQAVPEGNIPLWFVGSLAICALLQRGRHRRSFR